LGDFTRAQTYIEQALDIAREIGDRRSQSYWLSHLGLVLLRLGDSEAAMENSRQALSIAQELEVRSGQGFALTVLGHALTGLERLDEATDAYRQALALRRELGQIHQATEPLAGLARIFLIQGDLPQACDQVEQILSGTDNSALDNAEEPLLVYVTCYRVTSANQDPRARGILANTYRLLQERAAKIDDEEMRRSFLENVAAHREIVEEWERLADGDDSVSPETGQSRS
jgi:ATP/maltotriose-dependent transcriptional regulator MalT